MEAHDKRETDAVTEEGAAAGESDAERDAAGAPESAPESAPAPEPDSPGAAGEVETPREADGSDGEAVAAEAAEADGSEGRSAGESDDAPGASLESELAEARRAARDGLERALRAQAELENVRRRLERDLEKAHKFAIERFVSELLPVKDSLELGLDAAGAESATATSIAEGVELTLRMFEQVLDKFGVTTVDPAGEGFDPAYHQAMTMQESDSADSGTVLNVVQKGYVLNERLVRPAMVIVAK